MKVHRLNFLHGPAERYRRLSRSKKIISTLSALALLVLGGVGVMMVGVFAVQEPDLSWPINGVNSPYDMEILNLGGRANLISFDGGTGIPSRNSECFWMDETPAENDVTISASCLNKLGEGSHTLAIQTGNGTVSRTLVIYSLHTTSWQQESGSSLIATWAWYPTNAEIDGTELNQDCLSSLWVSDGLSQTTISGTCMNNLNLEVGSHTLTLIDNNESSGGTNASFPFTVTAAPEPTTYTITFKPDNGEADIIKTINAGDTIGSNMPTDPTYGTYTFAGWYDESGRKIESTEIPTGATTYTAHWDSVISYNANGTGATVSPTSATIAKGDKITSLPTPTRSGYTFVGWYTSATGGTQIKVNETTPTGNATYYAHWASRLTFDPHDGSSTITKDVSDGSTIGNLLPTDPTRDGHEFEGWYTSCTGGTKVVSTTKPAGNATYCAHWTVELTMNDGGQYQKGSSVVAIATPKTKKTGTPKSVKVDGVELTNDQYTVDTTTGVITLKTDFVNSLEVGKHTLYVRWSDDSESEVDFWISKEGPIVNKNGDPHEIGNNDPLVITPDINQGEPEYVKIDDKEIGNNCYNFNEESGAVTVIAECLNNLDEGEHTLTIGWGDGTESSIKFMITRKAVPTPNTGGEVKASGGVSDNSAIFYLIPVAVFVVAALGGWAYHKKKVCRKFGF